MARISHNNTAIESPLRQADSELVYHSSGLIEGTISYKVDGDYQVLLFQKLGDKHPDDKDITLYQLRLKKGKLGLMHATYDCIGLFKDPTDRVISFPNSVSAEPIETHPYFNSPGMMAGDPPDTSGSSTAKGANGAVWQMSEPDPKNQNKRTCIGFLGFTEKTAPKDLRGVRSYFVGQYMCRTNYYTAKKPKLKAPTTIQQPEGDLPAFAVDLKWLHLISSCEMVNKANIWRVTEEYIAGRLVNKKSEISDRIYG